MIIKICKVLFLCLWMFSFTANASVKELVVEKEINWSHPVLNIFKKYNITLSKIRYFKDGTCPVFYVSFQNSLRDKDYNKTYEELLKANSNFPYALVDKRNDLMVNVGWNEDIPSRILVSIDKIRSSPYCYGGGSKTYSFKFKMNPKLKKDVLSSPYKVLMKRSDGKAFMAYLYAEDGISHSSEYETRDGKIKKTIATSGNFYIYLYDLIEDKFLPNKIAPFYSSQNLLMKLGRSEFTVLTHNKKNQSDVLFINKIFELHKDEYEAYGFSEDLKSLRKYFFTDKEGASASFYGKISPEDNMTYGYSMYAPDDEKGIKSGGIHEYKLSISDKAGEINVELIR